MQNQTSKRKHSHIDICLKRDVQAIFKSAGFEDIEFVHQALPGLDYKRIDTTCKFLKRKMKAPLIIEAITGGYGGASRINVSLAEAAEQEGVAIALGSQRAMIENRKLTSTYEVRKHAPSVPILGNIGIAQIKKYNIKDIEDAVSRIDADALVVHLNALQEICQKEGDRDFSGLLKSLSTLCSKMSCPIIVKETGAGISMDTAVKLKNAGVAMIDVAGAGGTSWSAVELYRGSEDKILWDWGIPTVQSVVECSSKVNVPIIASGGVRSGLDIAKSISVGATYAGAALPFLKTLSCGGSKALCSELYRWKHELKSSMFLCGAKDLKSLSKVPVLITGRTAKTLNLRGIETKKLAKR